MGKSRTKVPIGWREWVSLPDLGIANIKVKVDTGARSSSLHAYDIEFERRRGKTWVLFSVHPRQRNERYTVKCVAELHDVRRIKSSNGIVQERPVLRTLVRIGHAERAIDLTLTPRDEMGFRMLLGREAVRGAFLVDPGRSYLSRPKPV